VADPARLATEARAIAKEFSLSCRVFEEAELKKRKMHGILAVGQGSSSPPRLIVLEHKPRHLKGKPYKRVVVVGKGITFDTGGISIKPAEKLDLMKYDKSGACAVLAILATVARLKLPLHVVGLAACAENMPSGAAYRPGDILTMSNGKTVEVLNTDAEGRMVLADALHFAGSFKPDAVIDLATLTGAIEIALGRHYCGLMGTDEGLQERLEAAGKAAGERVWRMPIGEEYQEQIKGTHGDLVNIGGRSGGALTAGQFLANFAPEDVPWAHLDIAGMAWSEKDEPEATKGATGFGVRLVSRFLLGLAE
jgi:leucyl aminopeptidase